MADPDDTLPSLDDLQRRIDALEPEKDEAANNVGSAYAQGMRIAIELFAGVGVGCFIGYQIDKAANTLPLFLIIFLLLGFAAGLRNVLRNMNKDQGNDVERP